MGSNARGLILLTAKSVLSGRLSFGQGEKVKYPVPACPLMSALSPGPQAVAAKSGLPHKEISTNWSKLPNCWQMRWRFSQLDRLWMRTGEVQNLLETSHVNIWQVTDIGVFLPLRSGVFQWLTSNPAICPIIAEKFWGRRTRSAAYQGQLDLPALSNAPCPAHHLPRHCCKFVSI